MNTESIKEYVLFQFARSRDVLLADSNMAGMREVSFDTIYVDDELVFQMVYHKINSEILELWG